MKIVKDKCLSRGRPKGTIRGGKVAQIKSRYFRLVIPNLQQYRDQPPRLNQLKGDTLKLILAKQNPVGLQFYKIAVETHVTTGIPHLDILLLYKASRSVSLNRFDYLVKHGNLSKYGKLNAAILEYGDKEDLNPLTNLPTDVSLILKTKLIQNDPYLVMRTQMRKDPFHFNIHEWLFRNNLDLAISKVGWSKHISLLKHQQQATCNQLLHDKPGFIPLTLEHIRTVLSKSEYSTFFKNKATFWPIILKINEIMTHGFNRPFKSKQLLLVSPPDMGKTTLGLKVRQFTSVYFMGVDNWFPRYRSGVYKMIFWDEFNLRSMQYPQLLKLLQGLPMDLPYKGGSALKTDNQLIYMTSNMSLEQHICSRFKTESARALSRANLRARIDQVILPLGVDLFLLLKLIKAIKT